MKRLLWTIVGIVITGSVIAMFTYTVNEAEYVVLTRFGRVQGEAPEPGLHFKLPYPIDRVNRLDKRTRLYEGRMMEFLTKDKKNIVVKCFVAWRLGDPMTFFQSVGSSAMAEQKLDDILTSKGGAAVGDFEFNDLISIKEEIRIAELEKRIQQEISEQTLKLYGVEILQTGVSRLALPEANAYAVYNRMRAERKAIANKYRAEGMEEASGIRAEADRQKSKIVSEAYKDAQVIRGEGDAEAARIYAEAFKRDPEFYKFWRTLQSYRKILDENTTLVLSEDSELFEYLRK